MNYQEWETNFQKLVDDLYEPSDSASFDEAFQEQKVINMKSTYPEHWDRWKSDRNTKS